MRIQDTFTINIVGGIAIYLDKLGLILRFFLRNIKMPF